MAVHDEDRGEELLTMTEAPPIDWDRQPLGKTPDRVLAKELKVAPSVVAKQRTLRGIPSCVISEAVVVELAPRGRKKDLLLRHVGFARFVWNWTVAQHKENSWPIGGKAGLADRIAAVEAKKRGELKKMPKKLSAAELSRLWTQQVDDIAPWARELCRSTVTYVIRAVDDAYKHAFRRLKAGEDPGWPKFRGKRHPHRAFTLQDQSFRHTRWTVKLAKIGMVPIRNKRRHDPLDRLKGARVLRIVIDERAQRWFCTLMVEREAIPVAQPDRRPVVGMDLGWKITLSDGRTYTPPRPLTKLLLWIRNWGRAMSRRRKPGQPPSKRWLRAKLIVQQLHLRAAMIRRNWIHQVTTEIAERYGTVVTEGFDVRRFVEHEVGRVEGRRTVLDIGWGDLRRTLAYKMERRRKAFLQLGKHELTDQTCSRCGHTDPRTDGKFRCPNDACGHTDTRPKNTADLLFRVGCGDPPPSFGSDGVETLPGEGGVNARGARNGRRKDGRGRRSEIGHAAGALGSPRSPVFFDQDPNARKTGDLPRPNPRASAPIATSDPDPKSSEEESPRTTDFSA